MTEQMSARHLSLLLTSAAAVICGSIVLLVPVTAVRIPFAIVLCLVLPGYAVTCATFTRQTITGAHVLLLTLAMSLGVLATGSVALDLLPDGVRTTYWVALLVSVVVVACAVAAARGSPPLVGQVGLRMGRPRRREMVLMVIGTLAVAGAITLARTPLSARNAQGYTQLWMLPSGSASSAGVKVGVTSGELQTERYRLEIRAGTGESIRTTEFILRPGRSRDEFVAINGIHNVAGANLHSRRITALLYRLDHPGVIYRRVFIWFPAAG
jgi:uncharacterized membrane protein